MIVCGWCGAGTEAGACRSCGRDPAVPWLQRGQTPQAFDAATERVKEQQSRLAAARRALTDAGVAITNAALAEELGVDERTVRRWMSAR